MWRGRGGPAAVVVLLVLLGGVGHVLLHLLHGLDGREPDLPVRAVEVPVEGPPHDVTAIYCSRVVVVVCCFHRVLGPGSWHLASGPTPGTHYTLHRGCFFYGVFFRDGKLDNGVNVLWEGGITDQV